MKLCLIVASLEVGGTERVVSTLANAWADKGQEVSLISFAHLGEPVFYSLDPRIQYHPLGLLASGGVSGTWRNCRRILLLRRAIRGLAPRAVISFADSVSVLTVFACLGLGIQVIASERTNPARQINGPIWGKMIRVAYRLADAVVFQTQRAARFFNGHLSHSSRVIPNPVIVENVFSKSALGQINSRTVLAVGRLKYEKGHDLLIEAFARIADRHRDWDLTIIGEGPFRVQLEGLIKEHRLENRVSLLGTSNRVHAALIKAGIFVLPSRFEGFPNALCEAMAAGLPVISFDCSNGPGEIISHDIDGLLVPDGDVTAMANAMDQLMKDPLKRQALSEKAVEINDRFDLDKVLGMWEDLLDEAINAGP